MAKNRLQKTAEYLEFARRILTNSIWIAIIIIILAAVGWFLSSSQSGDRFGRGSAQQDRITKPVQPAIDWQQVDKALAESMQAAHLDAREYAESELDKWIGSMMERVDDSFLDWYFSYWTQQVLGLKGLYQYGVHYVLETQPTASEKLTEEIQEEFSARVLRPQIAQRVLERIIQQTAERYVTNLQNSLDELPATYGISEAAWQEYLEDIAITTEQTDGGRQTPLTLKAMAVTGVGGTALLAGHMKVMVSKIGTKVMTKSSGKVASQMAAKTGGKVVAKVGGKFFGAIAGFGVLVWDLWDHTATKNHNRPLLRESLEDYFQELKAILLEDPDYGIMAVFYQLETKVVDMQSSG